MREEPVISHQSSVISRQSSVITYHVSRITYYTGFVILALLLALAAWYILFPSSDDALTEIRQRGTLRVGLDASFPPFESLDDDGQIVGLDVDIAQAIADNLGVELELVNIGFDGLYDALLARRVDLVISGLPYDPRWTEDVSYSRNYFNAGQVLITRVDNAAINAPTDVISHTIAVEWGSQADMEGRHLTEQLTGVDVVRQATAAEAIEAVLTGQTDAAIVDAVSATAAFPRGLKIVAYLTDEWYAAAVHIDSQSLLAAVNDGLAKLEASGEMARLQAKWLHGQ